MINEILYFLNLNLEPLGKWYLIKYKKTQGKTIIYVVNKANNFEYIIKAYDENFFPQYENEKNILETINGKIFSPTLIKSFTVTTNNTKLFCLILEKIHGSVLDNYNFICPVTKVFLEKKFTDVFLNIFEQYEKLHQLNIAHIDSHGSNIIISEHNNIYILDFEVSFFFSKNKFYSKKDLATEPFKISYKYDKHSPYCVQDYFINLDYGRIVNCMISILTKYDITPFQFESINKICKLKYYGSDKLFSYFNYLVLNYADFGKNDKGIKYLESTKKKYDHYFSNVSSYKASIALNAFYNKCIWYTKREYVEGRLFLMNSSKNRTNDFVLKSLELKNKYIHDVYILNYINQKINAENAPIIICNFSYNNKFYILMEKINGISLKDKIFSDEIEIINVYKDILKITNGLHSHGIFNIMYDSSHILLNNKNVVFINFSNSISTLHPEKYYIDNNIITYPYDINCGVSLFNYLKTIDIGQIFISLLEKCAEISITYENFITVLTHLDIEHKKNEKILFYFNNVMKNINYYNIDTTKIEKIENILLTYKINYIKN